MPPRNSLLLFLSVYLTVGTASGEHAEWSAVFHELISQSLPGTQFPHFYAGAFTAVSEDWAFAAGFYFNHPGKVAVYHRAPNNTWAFSGQILQSTATPEESGDFGNAIATDGNWTAIANLAECTNNQTYTQGLPCNPTVYIFRLQGERWEVFDKLRLNQEDEPFFFAPDSLALKGKTLAIVGEPNHASIMFLEFDGTRWVRTGNLEGTSMWIQTDGDLRWATFLDLDAEAGVAIGGIPVAKNYTGLLTFFRRNPETRFWSASTQVEYNPTLQQDKFSWCVAIRGNIALASSPAAGTIYVYHYNGEKYTRVQAFGDGTFSGQSLNFISATEFITCREGTSIDLYQTSSLVVPEFKLVSQFPGLCTPALGVSASGDKILTALADNSVLIYQREPRAPSSPVPMLAPSPVRAPNSPAGSPTVGPLPPAQPAIAPTLSPDVELTPPATTDRRLLFAVIILGSIVILLLIAALLAYILYNRRRDALLELPGNGNDTYAPLKEPDDVPTAPAGPVAHETADSSGGPSALPFFASTHSGVEMTNIFPESTSNSIYEFESRPSSSSSAAAAANSKVPTVLPASPDAVAAAVMAIEHIQQTLSAEDASFLKGLIIPFNSIRLVEEIGSGSFGTVYLGQWQHTKVAIKLENSLSKQGINYFLKEVVLTALLKPHPNVVSILAISLDRKPAIVMEYCSGGSLEKLLFSSAEITDQQKIQLAHGIALGLYHLHSNKVTHRDISARNVLLNKAGEPKIADMGHARQLIGPAGKTKTNFGPLLWSAPETLKSGVYSQATDVWMFGVTLTEIINRTPPHHQQDLLTVGAGIRDQGLTPALERDGPPVLVELVASCLQFEADQRPSFNEICSILSAHVDS